MKVLSVCNDCYSGNETYHALIAKNTEQQCNKLQSADIHKSAWYTYLYALRLAG